MQIRTQLSHSHSHISPSLLKCLYGAYIYERAPSLSIDNSEAGFLSEGEMAVLLSTSERSKEFKKTLEAYNEFKRLREQIGKPVRGTIDSKQIRRDLTGEDFYALLRDIEKRKR